METRISVGSSLFSFLRITLTSKSSSVGNSTKRSGDHVLDTHPEGGFPITRVGAVVGTSIFALFFGVLVLIYLTMPNLDPQVLKIPKDLRDLQIMKEHISLYTQDYTLQVLVGYVAVYIFMQTFMIPGTIFFSLLAGALFGVYKGVLLVIFSATSGAACCFLMSKSFGTPIALWLWPQQIRFFRAEVAKRKGKLLNYLLFLRVTPTLPNTFINFASPIVGIPYHTFVLATAIGLIPASFLTVRAGLTLGQLESVGDLYDVKTVSGLFVIGVCFILPAILSRSSKPS